MERALTARQRCFIEEYLKDLNATQACIRAGYSRKNADKIGPELLGKTRVFSEIQRCKKIRAQRTEVTQDSIIRELAGLAFINLDDPKISEGIVKVRDKVQSLIKLGEHTGLFGGQGENHGGDNSGKDTEAVDRRLSELFEDFERIKSPRADGSSQS